MTIISCKAIKGKLISVQLNEYTADQSERLSLEKMRRGKYIIKFAIDRYIEEYAGY